MVIMIPAAPRKGANRAEQTVFSALEGIVDKPDWVVLHSVDLGQNFAGIEGELDFLVLAPEHGILLIETKSAKSVQYAEGNWYLEKNPSPTKNPFQQLNGARRTLRGFLKKNNALGSEPFARLVWFTSLGRHHMDNSSPGDLQFFEWELAWSDDLARPAAIIEKTLSEHFAWFDGVDEVKLNPQALTAERATEIRKLILADFVGYETPDSAKKRRISEEQTLLDDQLALLSLVETNQHLYFDGPPGTGKTFLLAEAARHSASSESKTLVTCYNILMAAELETMVGGRPGVDVKVWNRVLLDICGLRDNPELASTEWFEEDLPALALKRLEESPYLADYDAIFVDEFQDISSHPLHRELLVALMKNKEIDATRVVLAGDSRQQIMIDKSRRKDSLASARLVIPHLVHVRLARNCRMAPQLAREAQKKLKIANQFTLHRVPESTEGGLSVVPVESGGEVKALAKAVRSLLETYRPQDIVILSPFGLKSSLSSELMMSHSADGPWGSADAKWLRKQLRPTDENQHHTAGITWHSIFKFKGLEADAVIITDVSPEAIDFAHSRNIDFDDTLFVGMTRPKYHCVVLDSAQYLS